MSDATMDVEAAIDRLDLDETPGCVDYRCDGVRALGTNQALDRVTDGGNTRISSSAR